MEQKKKNNKKQTCHYSQMIWFLNQENTNTNLKRINFNKWINEVYGFKVITEIYNVCYSEA